MGASAKVPADAAGALTIGALNERMCCASQTDRLSSCFQPSAKSSPQWSAGCLLLHRRALAWRETHAAGAKTGKAARTTGRRSRLARPQASQPAKASSGRPGSSRTPAAPAAGAPDGHFLRSIAQARGGEHSLARSFGQPASQPASRPASQSASRHSLQPQTGGHFGRQERAGGGRERVGQRRRANRTICRVRRRRQAKVSAGLRASCARALARTRTRNAHADTYRGEHA